MFTFFAQMFFAAALFFVLLICYAVSAVFSCRLARLMGVKNPYHAFFPIARSYMHFEMLGETEEITFFGKQAETQAASALYIAAGIVVTLSAGVSSTLFLLLAAAYTVFRAQLFQYVYKAAGIPNVGICAVLTAILPPVGWVLAWISHPERGRETGFPDAGASGVGSAVADGAARCRAAMACLTGEPGRAAGTAAGRTAKVAGGSPGQGGEFSLDAIPGDAFDSTEDLEEDEEPEGDEAEATSFLGMEEEPVRKDHGRRRKRDYSMEGQEALMREYEKEREPLVWLDGGDPDEEDPCHKEYEEACSVEYESPADGIDLSELPEQDTPCEEDEEERESERRADAAAQQLKESFLFGEEATPEFFGEGVEADAGVEPEGDGGVPDEFFC